MIEKYYEGTSLIVNLSTEIGKLLGTIDASFLRKPTTLLRKENRIKTIQSSLEIEGNTLSLEQVTALFENKRVIGPAKDVQEALNAIKVYERLKKFNPFDENSYLEAHKILMFNLIENAGKYRTKGVGIFKGNQVAHMAPPAWNVHFLMEKLFNYLNESEDNLIIKSCVFHYEMEFIHPFMDGNGRMGRLWQTVILMKENPVFEFLPLETLIRNEQANYYNTLAQADKEGVSTKFVEYMLAIIKMSLEQLIGSQRAHLTSAERMEYFKENVDLEVFTRKDYMQIFKNISSATASRDLKKAVEMGILIKTGDYRVSQYFFQKE